MKMVLVGASGYGAVYIDLIKKFVDLRKHELSAVVDPFIDRSPHLQWLKERGVFLHESPDHFLKENAAELVMICSPIQFHKEQSIMAMRHGSSVLCEKPVAPTPEDAADIQRVQRETGVPFGVGFQWSFFHGMLALKRDILDGKYGKAKRMRTLIGWKRNDEYYSPEGWKGKVRDNQGRLILDSVAMNATAHYLHNILFLLGREMDSARMPLKIEGSVYRARNIESYDTIFLRGEMPDGAEIIFTASHVTKNNTNPVFSYEFEKGTVVFGDHTGQEVRAILTDGSVKSYGYPQKAESAAQKILSMIDATEEKTTPVCNISTVMPHLKVCKAVHDCMAVNNFSAEKIVPENNPLNKYVMGLDEAMQIFYETGAFPLTKDFNWAGEISQTIPL